MSLSFNRISFSYDNIQMLISDFSASLYQGWYGVTGENGSGKTTLLELAASVKKPLTGSICAQGKLVFCQQRTDFPPPQLHDFLKSSDPDACRLRGKLKINQSSSECFSNLSHGERKKLQIAAALWQNPDVLLIDEPANHIDADTRNFLIKALSGFRKTGLIVSHDRELLDQLCSNCFFLVPPSVTLKKGNYTAASEEIRQEVRNLREKRQNLVQKMDLLKKESIARHHEAALSDRKRSKRGLAPKDSDSRAKIDLARVSGKDGQAGRLAKQMEGRMKQLSSDISSFSLKKEYNISYSLSGSSSPNPYLLYIPEGSIQMGNKTLYYPELTVTRNSRIAITGENGCGKSTLIRFILSRLKLEEDRLLYLPQEISLTETESIMAEVHSLPKLQLGKIMTAVSSLGSRPERILNNTKASPGELRKVLLALGSVREPYLIVMDEPTNHLDLPSIECLERCLMYCPCAVIAVSHDRRFLGNVTDIEWKAERQHEEEVSEKYIIRKKQ